VDRLLPGADFESCCNSSYATADHHHGAMLIISSDAAREAARFEPTSAIVVERTELSTGLVTRLMRWTARRWSRAGQVPCGGRHRRRPGRRARADAARGSRFNNPIRYLHDNPPNTVILVFSSDGGVDILPQLRPRMDPAVVRPPSNRYVDLVAAAPPVWSVYQAWNRVSELAFYLSEEDCAAVNGASARLSCRVR